MNKIVKIALVLSLIFLMVVPAMAEDYYVSVSRGKGKKATMEKPAKDLGNIISKLKAGDVVHIAGGTYLGKGKSGSDIITVPVSIIGGYSDDFSTRDPWGANKTILSGDNTSKNWVATPRLMIDLMKYREKLMPAIVVDGVIVDHAGRNHYKTEEQLEIVRKASPKTGKMPTPDMGGLVIRVSKTGNFDAGAIWNITVQNCIVMNTAPTQGALSVSGHKSSKITIRNNVVINNTGTGIMTGTKFISYDGEGMPEFLLENNTVLFTWKYDPVVQSFSGNSLALDGGTVNVVKNNVFGFADRFGINNASKASILLMNNIVLGNTEADYLEFDTQIALEDVEDEAEYLHEDSEENISDPINIPISSEWANLYASRVLIDRNAMEADIEASNTGANALRSMLGLSLQAGDVEAPSSPVWLNRLSVDDAVEVGSKAFGDNIGASMPKI